MEKLQLREEYLEKILTGEVVCPFCGQEVKNGVVCDDCAKNLNDTKAIEKILLAYVKAKDGHDAALSGGINRNTICSQIGTWRIPKNAKLMFPKNQAVNPYLASRKYHEGGGYIEIFFFGANADQVGQEVTGIVELKEKEFRPGVFIPYIRVQVIPGVKSDVVLSFNTDFEPDLPQRGYSYRIGKNDINFTVGFKKAA